MGKIPVFLDTDVLISALLSSTGASYQLVKHSSVNPKISKSVAQELAEVADRLKVDKTNLKNVLRKINITSTRLTKAHLVKIYGKYVLDEEDSHVVAGAHRSKYKFLLTHNTRHYKGDKIQTDLKIIVLKPGYFLQYLRSQSKF